MRHLQAAALGLLAGGCSLLLSTAEPMQCASQRDCDANPSFRNRVCEEGFCVVPRAQVDPVSKDAGPGCVSTDLCTQANSGKASVCKTAGGACTPWQTEQCRFVSGAWRESNPIVIGVIQPYSVKQVNGQLAPIAYADRIQRAIDLGLGELESALPGGIAIPGDASRKLAVIYCDSYFDPARAQDAMAHLTDVASAQAIIVGGDLDLAAIRDQALAKKTAVVCSDCVAPFPPGPLAWRIVPPLAQEAAIAAWRIAQLEAAIKAAAPNPSSIRVAVLTTPDPGPKAFVSALAAKLTFNGTDVEGNGGAFTVRTTEDPTKEAVQFVASADALATFAPDVLVVAMGAEFSVNYLQLLEAKWPTTKPKPHYVMTALDYELAPFVGPIGQDDDLRKRISGTRPAFDAVLETNVAAYTQRYKLAYNFKGPDGNFSGYDAFYALAYAIVAASKEPFIDGPHVSVGFERLRSGEAIDVGPDQLGLGLALLGSSSSINLRGLVSGLDWDVVTRDLVAAESSLYCFERDGSGALVLRPDAGPRMNNATGVVTGTYSCN